ncbi:MAG: DUF3363 domain-containing protein [Hyphomonas sp.]
MSADDPGFRPRLGHIGTQDGQGHGKQTQIAKFAAHRQRAIQANTSRLPAGTIRYQGRGKGAAAIAAFWARTYRQHVIVKVYIANAGPTGNGKFTRFLSYMRRDGTDPDGQRGRMYSDSEDEVGAKEFNERSRNDTHQFRIIVSAENGGELEDLRILTRTLMAQANTDLSTELDWVAVNHFDTTHPHTHIVVRGADRDGNVLYIDGKYLMSGLRHRAEEIMTRELGQRAWRDITAARALDVQKDAFTSLDRLQIEPHTNPHLEFTPSPHVFGRYERSLVERRLQYLQANGLAGRTREGRWRLEPGWTETLKTMSRQKIVADHALLLDDDRSLQRPEREFAWLRMEGGEISGRVIRAFPTGELRERVEVHIDGLDGNSWRAHLSEAEASHLPKAGGVVSLSVRGVREESADRTIEEIAARHHGVYSEAIHSLSDPKSTSAFRLAHTRRLTHLARAGIVQSPVQGAWRIPAGLSQLAQESAVKSQAVRVTVLSWLPVETLITRRELTWLDRNPDPSQARAEAGFAGDVARARVNRRAWLQSQMLAAGHLEDVDRQNLRDTLSAIAERSGKQPSELGRRGSFHGTYSQDIDLARQRFAVIEGADRVIAVPWSGTNAHLRGQEVVLRSSKGGIEWQRGRSRH